MKNSVQYVLQATLIITAFGFTAMIAFVLGAEHGRDQFQQTIEDRAMELPDFGYETECYDWQEIEYVIFGETQE